uniref:hypothetical protein n=1 Tax=Gimesia panareensis TaxID=2527978 RepID=UPI0018D7812C|nr:hypothetical protein [Gimesia panareensis]
MTSVKIHSHNFLSGSIQQTNLVIVPGALCHSQKFFHQQGSGVLTFDAGRLEKGSQVAAVGKELQRLKD